MRPLAVSPAEPPVPSPTEALTTHYSPITILTYDDLHRRTQVTDANNHTVTTAYNNRGLVSSITDARSKVTSFTYNSRGLLTQISYPDSTSESFGYDNASRKTSHTDGKAQTVNYSYDNANRLTTIDYPTGTDTTFTYDNADRKTQMVDGIGTTNYTYDNANRLTQVEGPYKTVSYGYDNGGRRTSLGITGQNNVTYSYNAADYVTSLTNANNETTSWTYNDVGLPTRQDSANSTYAQWTYDANRYWLTEVHNKKSDASTISRFQYTRDSVGNPTAMTETNGTLGAASPWSYTFTYDNVYQLTGETKKDKNQSTAYTITYEYDAAGNRTKKTEDGNETNYSYDDFNKMTAAGSVSFGYDNNGNMTSKTENSQTTTYSYDYENHMTGITYPNQSTNSFGYYGTGQRAWKVDSSGTTRFICDGTRRGARILAQVNSGGDYTVTYTHGVPGLVSQRRASATNWYAFDQMGNTANLTAASQTVTDAYAYRGFGELSAAAGTTQNAFRYAGAVGYYDDTEGALLVVGGRYYGPGWGRFTTVNRAGGGANRFVYAASSPIALNEPSAGVSGKATADPQDSCKKAKSCLATWDFQGALDLICEYLDCIASSTIPPARLKAIKECMERRCADVMIQIVCNEPICRGKICGWHNPMHRFQITLCDAACDPCKCGSMKSTIMEELLHSCGARGGGNPDEAGAIASQCWSTTACADKRTPPSAGVAP